jgi:hypothetical protein
MWIFVISMLSFYLLSLGNCDFIYCQFNYDVRLLVRVGVTYKYDNNFIAIGEGGRLGHTYVMD